MEFSLLEAKRSTRADLAHALNQVLANTFLLYLMSRNFHWNIASPRHQSFHKLFEEHYRELSEAIDEIAIRIRALGGRAAATQSEYQALATIKEPDIDMDASNMACHAGVSHHQAVKTAQVAWEIARELKDATTEDLLFELITLHEKYARDLGGVFINN